MRKKNLNLPLSVFLTLSVSLIGCSVWVPSKDNGEDDSGSQSSAIARIHINQAIEVASDKSTSVESNSTALALTGLQQDFSCSITGNQMQANSFQSNTVEQKLPAENPTQKVVLTQSLKNEVGYSSEQSEGFGCTSDNKAVLVYSQIEEVTINTQTERKSRRQVFTLEDESIQDENLDKTGAIVTAIKKQPSDAGLLLEITSSVKITLDYSLDKKEEPLVQVNSSVETTAEAPLKIQKAKNAEGKTISKILTGKMVSNNSDGNLVESVFTNVEVEVDANCTPISGVVLGSVYTADRSELLESYEVAFSADKIQIDYKDGNIEELFLTGCAAL